MHMLQWVWSVVLNGAEMGGFDCYLDYSVQVVD